ncbi:DMT family transporter [Sulfobacillus sp. hq2]|uniref:DMT family transporter n=1 Tax=Sulfobacillus sp. hq2 TaxID=2039167 RepID=UPI000CD06EB6|nr:DMT family transporter [Sulfobacillus sp. hq2]POB11257.1 hypothetical protein CO251_05695 [Sulfobacillus sp. hq2]
MPHLSREAQGIGFGILGVVGFSLTLPASREAVPYFGAIIVAFGRAVIAAILAAGVLLARREPLPKRRQLLSLVVVAAGAIVCFPLLSAWAMDRLPASHGAVILALLPSFTAGASAVRNGERPSVAFWIASVAGAATVLGYAIFTGFGRPQPPDLALILADLILAVAYAEGGRLSTQLGGWQVIAWALVLAGPFLLVLAIMAIPAHIESIPVKPWVALLYLGIGSQFLAFVAWYTGMSLGGVAHISQMQFLQPFLTIVFSALLLHERITAVTAAAAVVTVGVVVLGKKTAVRTSILRDTNGVTVPPTDCNTFQCGVESETFLFTLYTASLCFIRYCDSESR